MSLHEPCLWQTLCLDVAQEVLRLVQMDHLEVEQEFVDELRGGCRLSEKSHMSRFDIHREWGNVRG